MKKPIISLLIVLMLLPLLSVIHQKSTEAAGGSPTLNQRQYRWRDDDGSETTAGWLAGESQSYSGLAKNTTIRLRIEIDNTGTANAKNQNIGILEYSTDAAGNCSNGSWTTIPKTVTSGEHWDLATSQLTDKSATTNNGFSSHTNSTFVAGKQVEEPAGGGNYNVTLTNANYIHTEAAIQANSNATDGDTYYIRVSGMNNHQQCATITLAAAGSLDVDIVDSGGSPVVSPSVSFAAKTLSFSPQSSDGTFGTTSERIRVTNTTAAPAWSLTIAATGGATAFWNGPSADYDFNDPTAGAGDGGDTDLLGGQLTVDASGSTVTPQGGCSNIGITKGSSAAFSENITDNITILSADGTAETGCYWEQTGISLSQTIPAEQAVDSYFIDMTVTVTAT